MKSPSVTLISGGSAGIGAGVARQLLGEGQRVAITGRDRSRLGKLAADLGNPASLLTVTADAADYDAVRAAVDSTVSIRRRK